MWIALYLVPAIAVAVAAWYVSKRFASFDPPNEVVRAVAVVAAGTLWPIVLLGLAQLQLVRYVARRIPRSGVVYPRNTPSRLEVSDDGVMTRVKTVALGCWAAAALSDVHRGDGAGGRLR